MSAEQLSWQGEGEVEMSNEEIWSKEVLLVEVQWGIIPGTVDDSKRWGFTREQVEAAFEEEQTPGEPGAWRKLMHDAYEEFDRRMNPRYHNWVTLTWLWL